MIDEIIATAKALQDKIKNHEREMLEKERVHKDNIQEQYNHLEKQRKDFEYQKLQFQNIQSKMNLHIKNQPEMVKLNVGGTIFMTSKNTLLKKGSFFEAMLGSENWKPDLNGQYFIDRDPVFFTRILYFMRSGVWNLSGLTEREVELLKMELDYYLIPFHKEEEKAPVLEEPESNLPDPKQISYKILPEILPPPPKNLENTISPKWIPTAKVTVSPDGKTTTNQTEGWNSVKTDPIPNSANWTIEIVSIGSGNLGMIGAIPAQTFIPNGTHFSSCGGGIYQPNSEVYTDGTWNVEVYNNNNWSPIKVGSKIRYEWDKTGRKLVMFVDGTKTVQFGNVPESIVPCVAFYGVGSVVKFL